MLMTFRQLCLHPAVVLATLGYGRNQADSLAQLDRHTLRDIGVEPGQVRGPALLTTVPGETASPPRSGGRPSRPTNG